MSAIVNVSRRDFFKTGMAVGGGLILGFALHPVGDPAGAAQPSTPTFAPKAFLRIGSDGLVTILANHSEMGQGVYTALPMLVAEELEVDWSHVRVEAAPVDPAYNHTQYGMQMTGGSTSTWSEWERLRQAGATARMMLIAAAAQAWNVDPASCRAENGFIIHSPSRRQLSYGELAERAAHLTPPQNAPLKDPKDFKLIGKPIKRLDTPEKINGTAVFGLDVNVLGMLTAVVARPPVFGGKVKSIDANQAKATPGVRHVVEIERGVAVVADGYWSASKGREVWTGTQFQTVDRMAAAQAAGLKPEQVNVHTTLLGGGFGRRAVFDSHFVREAVQISKAVKAPIKVMWTREDDTRGGYYRPLSYHSIGGGLDASGNPVAWRHRIVCQSFIAGTAVEAAIIKDGVDHTAVEGAAELPYDIPNLLVDWKRAPDGVPTLWWRSVGHSHTAFVVESFVDELAHAAGKDPLGFRRALLGKHPRYKAVLELAADKAGWGTLLPEGHGRGLAVHESFGSLVAEVAQVSITREGQLKVHRVVCAVDCGPIVNPDTIQAQMESAVVFGLTAALYGEITLENGRVQQRNFHDYPMLRMNEMPVVETHIMPSTAKMGGIGETGVPPIAPAVANAVFAATGKRIRRLPIRAEDLRKA